jgi:Putative small multi-drug export protein.
MKKNYLIVAKFLIPICLGVVFIFLVYLIGKGGYLGGRGDYWTLYGMMFAGTVGGRLSLSIGIAAGFNPLFIIGIGTVGDGIAALWVLWNWDLIYRVPKIGKTIELVKIREEEFFKSHRKIERGSFLGLVTFLMSPFQIGGVYASVLSKIIGMRTIPSFFAILLGSFLGGVLVVFSTRGLVHAFKSNWLLALLIAGVVIAGLLLYYHFRTSIHRGG